MTELLVETIENLKRWEKKHSKKEEIMNILTHGIGMGLSMAGLTILVSLASVYRNPWAIVSCSIFGITMFLVYFASTFCHFTTGSKGEKFFEIFDNIAIYFLIAGTYTPFALCTMKGSAAGWAMFGIIWALAIVGTVLRIYYNDRHPKKVVLLYLAMGWTFAVFSYWLVPALTSAGLTFLLIGGACYTVGILFYIWRKLPFSHTIWHLFVLSGSIMHFFSILYGCVLI